jgi:predicted NUDIX family NTP pyrophosphohydrolase
MPRTSAGLLVYRRAPRGLQVLLVHPGGPFWAKKDLGAWTIPKGEVAPDEELLATAKREFREELGLDPPEAPYYALEPIKQKGGKIVHAWAVEGDVDTTCIKSNVASIEWPYKSGKQMQIPEIDRAEFFDLPTARAKMNAAQAAFVDELARLVGRDQR